MTNREVARHFADAVEPAEGSNLAAEAHGRGMVLCSYGTPIAARAGRWAIFSPGPHSQTTAVHLGLARDACLASDRVGHIAHGDEDLRGALDELGFPQARRGRLAA